MVFNRSTLLRTRLALAGVLAAPAAFALAPQSPELVSRNFFDGGAAFGVCSTQPRFGPNPRHLVFGCGSDDLVPGDDNERNDVFLLDRQTGQIERVSVDGNGEEMRYHSTHGFVSLDGTTVVFESNAPLHPDVTLTPPQSFLGKPNAFVRDRLTGDVELASRDIAGGAMFQSSLLDAALPDRDEVMFRTFGRVFEPGDWTQTSHNLYIRNWVTGFVELVSVADDGGLADGSSSQASFSGTGRYVVFHSTAGNIADGVLGVPNLFLRDRQAGTTTRLTYPWHGGEFEVSPGYTYDPTSPGISADGRHVVFAASGQEFVENYESIYVQVYWLDRQSGEVEPLSRALDGGPSNGSNQRVSISADARYVAFFSRATNLPAPGPTPAIYVLDRLTGELVNVTAPLGGLPDLTSILLDLAHDGSAITFIWRATNPTLPPDWQGRLLVYTVALRGAPPPPPVPVPAASPRGLGWLVLLMLLAAGYRLRRTAVERQQ